MIRLLAALVICTASALPAQSTGSAAPLGVVGGWDGVIIVSSATPSDGVVRLAVRAALPSGDDATATVALPAERAAAFGNRLRDYARVVEFDAEPDVPGFHDPSGATVVVVDALRDGNRVLEVLAVIPREGSYRVTISRAGGARLAALLTDAARAATSASPP